MTVYPEMNNKIVDLLRMGDTPVELYAAQRIEELELKNKELFDRVLEIIDEEADAMERGGYGEIHGRIYYEHIKEAVLALKGGEDESNSIMAQGRIRHAQRS